ncbi:MAG: alpha/beta hydrolase [Chitinophagaceae bacterium]|nr:MAG: alpha/beta hydrolase [Chitinophagaceae bacterium]
MATPGKFTDLVMVCTALLCYMQASAQDIWGAYGKTIAPEKYQGKNFRYKALVKSEITDDSAAAHLWVRIDKTQGQSFFDNMAKRPIRNSEWKEYEISGKIDTGVRTITFGMYCIYNGKFQFDDMLFEVQNTDGGWTPVFTEKFETGKNPFSKGIGGGSSGVNDAFVPSFITGYKGSKSMQIQSRTIPIYGMDKKNGKYAEVNGIKLYYEVYGTGQPMLVLHGNGGSIASASEFYKELSAKYKIIAIDSRGQGKSGDTDAPLTYDQMASDVNTLLDQINIDSAYIWGQSDGAILGLLLAKDYPKKVKKVVAFGSNIQPDSSAIFQWAIDGIHKILSESKDFKEKRLNQMMKDFPQLQYDELAKIQAPVLVVAGDRDVIRPEHTLKIFQHIPKSQLFIVPGATHGASWEKKDLFLKVMYEFLDKSFTMPNTKDWYQ